MISDKEPVVFDLELMGKGDDIFFFFGARHLATGRTIALEGNDTATISTLITLMLNERYLRGSFNGLKFAPPAPAACVATCFRRVSINAATRINSPSPPVYAASGWPISKQSR